MDYLKFSSMDYLLFVFTFGVSCIIGIYFGCFRKQTSTVDYLFGGRNMKVFPVAMSLTASSLSGISLIAIPAEVYMHGLQIVVLTFSIIVMSIINNYVYLPVFHQVSITSAYDYLELRFGRVVKNVASILYLISCVLFMPVLVYAPSLVFNQMSGVDLHIIAPVTALICVFYTTIGGIKAVLWADTLQLFVTLFTLTTVLVMGVVSVGGLSAIWEKSKFGDRLNMFDMNPDPTIRDTFWSVFLGNTISWISLVAVHPSGIQRFLSVPKLSDARKALAGLSLLAVFAKLITVLAGLIVYTKYADCDPITIGNVQKADQIFPYYVKDVASKLPGISGMFAAAIFSTSLSTLSTQLNTVAGMLYLDFIRPSFGSRFSEDKSGMIMKLLTVFFGVIIVGLVFIIEHLGTLLETINCSIGITSGPLVGLFTLGMLLPIANSKGALAGTVCALLLTSVIIIQNQIYIWNGAIRINPKPLYTTGCNVTDFDALNLHSSTAQPEQDTVPWIFRISFHYYTLIGASITIMIGFLVSLCTKKGNKSVNRELLSPFLHRFLSPEKSQRDDNFKSVKYSFAEKKSCF